MIYLCGIHNHKIFIDGPYPDTTRVRERIPWYIEHGIFFTPRKYYTYGLKQAVEFLKQELFNKHE